MGITVEQFSADCSRILNAEPGPAGREKVCELLRAALKDESFVASTLTDDVPERKILYEDPKLGFVILAHHYKGAKESPPHDHGPYWAIYGQGRGETKIYIMTAFREQRLSTADQEIVAGILYKPIDEVEIDRALQKAAAAARAV